MPTYTPATIKRARTILANCEAKQTRNAPVKRAERSQRNAAKDAQMATRKPSQGQCDRINARHDEMDLRPYTLRSLRNVFPTMLDASMYWDSIKA